MSRLSASFLGALDLRLDDQPITTFEYDKVRALLVYLMVESDHPHRREYLAGLLWPDFTERTARQNLSQALLVLRRAIGDREADPPYFHITKQTLQFNTASHHTLDVSEFTSLINAVQQHAHANLETCDACMSDLEKAAALYRGNFMTGFSLPDCPEFEIWLTLERERLQQRALDAFYHLAEAFLLRGNYQSALTYAQRQLALDNLNEPAYRQAMTALATSGQRSAAMVQYETCKHVLQTELGIVPEPATSALHQQVSRGEYNGEQQTGKPGGQAKPVAAIPNNLPNHVSPFIGRQDLLEQLQRQLVDANFRLLTLLGPGGCGKTRLAQETGRLTVKVRDHDHFGDGVYFVPLAAIETVEGIVPAIAQAINLTFASGTEPAKQLIAYLSRKRILLILDNFEHLINGASYLVDLLRCAPHLKILVTTRVKLAISTEHVIDVPGMVYPDDAGVVTDITAYSALLLFQQFAHRVQLDFTVDDGNLPDVVKISQLVHGMPLGLLLASAWMHILEPSEIVAEIEHSLDFLSADWQEVPTRQRSMRAVFEHTWKLLSVKEQRMLASLAVFKGGWTREAALEVAQVTLRDLLVLINKCLVQRTPNGRYEMHELLRQFTIDKLSEKPELAQRAYQAHAHFYSDKLSEWWDDLHSPIQDQSINELSFELENARSAIDWLLDNRQYDSLEDYLDCLEWYFSITRRLDDGAAYFLTIIAKLDSFGSDVPKPYLAKVYSVYGWMLQQKGQTKPATKAHDESLQLLGLSAEKAVQLSYRDFPTPLYERKILANILFRLARRYNQTDLPRARHLSALCFRFYKESGSLWGQASVVFQLACTYMQAYKLSLSKVIFEKSWELYQQAHDPVPLVNGLSTEANWFVGCGDTDTGEICLQRAEQIVNQYGLELSYTFRSARASIYNNRGKYEACMHILQEMKQEFEELGLQDRVHYINFRLARVHNQLGEYETTIQIASESYEYYTSIQAEGMVRGSLGRLYTASLAAGQPQKAWVYYTKLAELQTRLGLDFWDIGEFYPMILYQLGRYDEMFEPIITWLKRTLDTHDLINLLCELPIVSLALLATQQTERATEVYALAYSHEYVANNIWFEDVAGKFVKQAAASLQADVVAAAEARGRDMDFWETAEALVTELEALQEQKKSQP